MRQRAVIDLNSGRVPKTQLTLFPLCMMNNIEATTAPCTSAAAQTPAKTPVLNN